MSPAPSGPAPSGPAAFDHVVVATRDLDAAAREWAAMGFTLTPRAVHPWGTANRLIQFSDRTFIELLEIADPGKLFEHDPAADPPVFSFGAWNRDFLRDRGEGISMLVFATRDRDADRARWAARGLAPFAPFDFERGTTLPDGTAAKVAFRLAFAVPGDMPGAAFFVCENVFPEVFWKPAFQRHANGVTGMAEVIMTAPRPLGHLSTLRALTAGDAVEGNPLGLVARLGPIPGGPIPGGPIPGGPIPGGDPRGGPQGTSPEAETPAHRLALLSPRAAERRLGLTTQPGTPAFAALRLTTPDLDAARPFLKGAEDKDGRVLARMGGVVVEYAA